jgi:hypothetical protein
LAGLQGAAAASNLNVWGQWYPGVWCQRRRR